MIVRRFKFVLLVVLLSLSSLWVVSWIGAHWLIVENTVRNPADVIVVLSGSSAFRERTQLAADLFKQGFGSSVLLTNDGQQGGWSNEKERNPFTLELATDSLVRSGVPATRIEIIQDPVVGSTYEEALAIKTWAEKRQVKSMLVVTSAYHGRRAVWTFRRVIASSPTLEWAFVPPGNQTPTQSSWWLYPKGWKTVGLEYVKLLYYRFSY